MGMPVAHGMSGAATRAVREQIDVLVAQCRAEGIEKLPPERELAATFGVSRTTVRRALRDLEERGVIVRTLGRSGGAFLSDIVASDPVPSTLFNVGFRKVQRDLNVAGSIPEMLAEQGFESGTGVISAGYSRADTEVATRLEIEVGAPVISLLRLRFADGSSLALERMYLDATRFPGLLDRELASTYGLLEREYGVEISRVHESIELMTADAKVAGILGVRPRSPLLALRRVAYSQHDWPAETSIFLFRGDRTRLVVESAGYGAAQVRPKA